MKELKHQNNEMQKKIVEIEQMSKEVEEENPKLQSQVVALR